MYCVETNKHSLNFFSQPGRPTILDFPYQTLWQYSDGNSPNWNTNLDNKNNNKIINITTNTTKTTTTATTMLSGRILE